MAGTDRRVWLTFLAKSYHRRTGAIDGDCGGDNGDGGDDSPCFGVESRSILGFQLVHSFPQRRLKVVQAARANLEDGLGYPVS